MYLNKDKKSHRFIIFLGIAIPVIIAGFWFRSYTLEKETAAKQVEQKEPKHDMQRPEKKEVFGPESYTYTEEEKETVKSVEIDESIEPDNLEESKKVAEQFAKAMGSYDSENPHNFLPSVENILGDELLQQWKESPPRRSGGLVSSKVKELETYPVDGGNNDYIAWNVVVVLEQRGMMDGTFTEEEWYWIVLSNQDGQWKIEEVDITSGG